MTIVPSKLALSLMLLPLLAVSSPIERDQIDRAPPVPDPPEPPAPARRQRLASALAGLVPLPPAPRPGSGRERHVRRLLARSLAGELKLREEDVYQALGRGESEEQIRARGAVAPPESRP